jgi:hypothetical protein
MTTNTVSGNASSVSSLATSVLGNARQVFKAIADAATSDNATDARAAEPAAPAKSARRGTVLDRYM